MVELYGIRFSAETDVAYARRDTMINKQHPARSPGLLLDITNAFIQSQFRHEYGNSGSCLVSGGAGGLRLTCTAALSKV
jgi:hypothetical protein